jgi:hypothetical protein
MKHENMKHDPFFVFVDQGPMALSFACRGAACVPNDLQMKNGCQGSWYSKTLAPAAPLQGSRSTETLGTQCVYAKGIGSEQA